MLSYDMAYAALEAAVSRNTDDITRSMKTIRDGLENGQKDAFSIDQLEAERRSWVEAHGHSTSNGYASSNGQPDEEHNSTVDSDEQEMPPLPDYAAVDEGLAAEASLWLDDYIGWSTRWAPRAYAGFHEAAALFLLATIAARRIKINLGLGMFTSLYIALISRTTIFTKSTVTDLAIAFLRKALLGYFLASDDCTPQAFIRSLTGGVPENYDDLTDEQQRLVLQRLAFAAQRGWYYEEWGQHLDAMMQRDGVMASFRSILRRFDDHKDEYTYETISRGPEKVYRPYVTLLANATPADVQPFMQPGGKLWRDGFLARIGLVVPSEDSQNNAPFPEGALTFPDLLISDIRNWHRSLGEPQISLDPLRNKAKEPTGKYRLSTTPAKETIYQLCPEVRTAFYAYDRAMREMLMAADQHDLDGSYGRFPVKALRIAALLSSLHDTHLNKTITLSAWYRGQAIAERWRLSLHRLVTQLQSSGDITASGKIEDHIIKVLKKHGGSSSADIYRWTKIPATDLGLHLVAMKATGVIKETPGKRSGTVKYEYVGPTS